jgi:hypothetical protein
MGASSSVKKSYVSAIGMRAILLLIGVALLLIYKPANYGIFIFAIVGAYSITAAIAIFAIRKARRSKQATTSQA